jgi:hypothetical protein
MYVDDSEDNTHESVMYSWNTAFKQWTAPKSRYVYSFDKNGRLLAQEHYTFRDSHGNWRGCNSDGCGKKEWAFDAMGNQILRTQSYWFTGGTNWTLTEIHENQFDLSGNRVLESVKTRSASDLTTWTGSKDEYSYDSNGKQTGHIPYDWGFSWTEVTSGGSVIFHEWDDWYPRAKEERQYDKNGNLSRIDYSRWWRGWSPFGEMWGGAPTWDRVDISYDPDGRKKTVLFYAWDFDLKDWRAGISGESVRDANGQLISEMEIQLSEYSGILPSAKEYAYDSKGNRVSEITTSWDSWMGTWSVKVKHEYAYDSHGRMVEDVLSIWDGQLEKWAKSLRTQFGFDPEGRQILKAEYFWNAETGEWAGLFEQEWVFDSQSNEVLHTVFTWDTGIRDWVGNTKTEHEYDKSGNMTLLAQYHWERSAGAWNGEGSYGKREWEYDPAGRLSAETEFIWNPEEAGWQEKIRVTAMHDPDGDPVAWRQTWWNPESREREMVIGFYFFYNSINTGRQELTSDVARVFPNPTEGRITITGLTQTAEIGLYSLQGLLLRTFTRVVGEIDISDVPAGVYVLYISAGNKAVLRQKVVKW